MTVKQYVEFLKEARQNRSWRRTIKDTGIIGYSHDFNTIDGIKVIIITKGDNSAVIEIGKTIKKRLTDFFKKILD